MLVISEICTPRIQSWWPHCHRPDSHQVQSRWGHTLQTPNMLVSGLHCLSQGAQDAKMLTIIAVRTPPLQIQHSCSRVKMETSPRTKICHPTWLPTLRTPWWNCYNIFVKATACAVYWLPCILWQPSTLNDIQSRTKDSKILKCSGTFNTA